MISKHETALTYKCFPVVNDVGSGCWCQVNHTYKPLPSGILLCVTYLLVAPGNLNPLPVEAKQLTRIVSVEVELALA